MLVTHCHNLCLHLSHCLLTAPSHPATTWNSLSEDRGETCGHHVPTTEGTSEDRGETCGHHVPTTEGMWPHLTRFSVPPATLILTRTLNNLPSCSA